MCRRSVQEKLYVRNWKTDEWYSQMCKCRMAVRLIIRRRRWRRKAKVNDAAYGDRWFINFPGARREKKRCRPSGDKYLVIPRRVEPFVRKIASHLSYHCRKIIVISPRSYTPRGSALWFCHFSQASHKFWNIAPDAQPLGPIYINFTRKLMAMGWKPFLPIWESGRLFTFCQFGAVVLKNHPQPTLEFTIGFFTR